MNEFEIIRHIMMLDHVTFDNLSERLGYKSKANTYQILRHKHIYVDTWRKFLSELGYEIVVREKGKTEGGYVISDDNEQSPLRFHDMSLNLDVIFGDALPSPKKHPIPTTGERKYQSEELKKRTDELTAAECHKELRRIWNIEDYIEGMPKPKNEYLLEYQQYCEEFSRLYDGAEFNTPVAPPKPKRKKSANKIKLTKTEKEPQVKKPVTEVHYDNGHGKVITEDNYEEKDMSEAAINMRSREQQRKQSELLRNLIADFPMED